MKRKKIVSLSLFAAVLLQASLVAKDIKNNESLDDVDVISTDTALEKGSYTVESMNTSTKLDLSIRHTPQSLSVFTSKELEDMGVKSYQDMLAHVTGVSLDKWDERLKASARGFDLDYYKIDGMPSYSTHNERDIDLSMYERVEVVRGANGLTTGAGNPGISINLVRKRAKSKEFTGSMSAEAGSWNTFGANVDIGSKLNESGSIRGRLVVNHEKSDSYMDGYEKENTLVYGVVEADLTDTTLVSLGASLQKLDRSGIRWGGLPAFDSNGNRVNFDRSKIVSEDWTYWDSEIKSIYANLEQYLFNNMKLTAAYTHNIIESNQALLYFDGKVNTSDGSGLRYMDFEGEKKNVEDNFDINLNIPYEVAGLMQETVLGASYNRDKTTKYDARYPNGYYTALPNFFDYDISLPAPSGTDVPYVVKPEQIEQKGFYLANKFSLSEDLKFIAGARVSSWEYSSTDNTKETRKFDDEITPYLGLVYDLDENHSIYSSYTSIFNPQDKKDKAGKYLDPIEGKAYEAGIKGEYFDGALNTSLSIFRIEQDGVATEDGKQIANPADDAFKASDGVTSKGFEVDIAGRITDNLTMNFGVANFKAEDAAGEKFNTQASRTTANLFAKYKIDAYTLGGGLQYKSKFYTGSGSEKITQDAYTIANAMLGYEVNKNTSLQLNVTNLFDKKYYEGIGANGMTYGDPRKFMMSLKYTF